MYYKDWHLRELAYWRTRPGNFRGILTATTRDFVTWSEPAALAYPGSQPEQLYVNVVKPYYRAPHILIGFPVRVELQGAAGVPLKGFSLGDCVELFGDDIDRRVRWAGNPDLAALAGHPVRLRFVMQDADLYAIQFGED